MKNYYKYAFVRALVPFALIFLATVLISREVRSQEAPQVTMTTKADDAKPSSGDVGWPNYGNDAGGSRYSTLTQVNRENVAQLKVAWTYRTGALEQFPDLKHNAAFETTPILVDGKFIE